MIHRILLTPVILLLPLAPGPSGLADDTNKGAATVDATKLLLQTRSRVEQVKGGGEFQEVRQTVRWDAKKTAVIVCHMWDDHTCKAAAARVAEMAATADRTVKAAREKGVLIIHAPSSRTSYYKDTPARRRAIDALFARPPVSIGSQGWNSEREGRGGYDFVLSGGCGCDKPCAGWVPDERGIRRWKGAKAPWTRQIKTIEITDQDAVSANGQEIYNLLQQRGIDNVIILGVHTNQCVIGRPLGIRQMVYLGKNLVLCRDLNDALFQPRSPDFDHFRGNDLVIEHIEKHWCPTITSTSLTGEPPFQFAADTAREAQVKSIYRFDMATEDSPVWPGFTKVTRSTLYTKDAGYGWVARPGAATACKHKNNAYKPDDLCCDWVGPGKVVWQTKGEIRFNIDLPSGDYEVYTILGDYQHHGTPSQYAANVHSHSVSAEGERKISVKISAKEAVEEYCYRHLNTVYRRGDDPWDKYVLPNFQPQRFKVKISDGQLNLTFTDCPVNTVVVYPVSESERISKELADTEAKRKESFPFRKKIDRPTIGLPTHLNTYLETITTPKPGAKPEQPPVLTEEDNRRGYVVFTPHYMTTVRPSSVPRPEQIGTEPQLKLFAARGEFEPTRSAASGPTGKAGCKPTMVTHLMRLTAAENPGRESGRHRMTGRSRPENGNTCEKASTTAAISVN